MGHEVPAVRTPVDPAAFTEQVGRSYISLFGQYPTRAFCMVILGQCFAECGDHGKNMWDDNVGNVQKTAGYDWQKLDGAWEMVNGARVNKPEYFRAFHSLEEGITQHLDFLARGAGGRYAPAYALALQGDCSGFAQALKAAGYYSGSEADYARLVTFFATHYNAAIAPMPWELEAQQAAADASAPVDGFGIPGAPDDTEPS